jgi:hypothetical protein
MDTCQVALNGGFMRFSSDSVALILPVVAFVFPLDPASLCR